MQGPDEEAYFCVEPLPLSALSHVHHASLLLPPSLHHPALLFQETVSELCELFAQVDVNNDGTMEWEEFSAFCIEAGMAATRKEKLLLEEVAPFLSDSIIFLHALTFLRSSCTCTGLRRSPVSSVCGRHHP